MQLLHFPYLADENIQPAVVKNLQNKGLNILSVSDVNYAGKTDLELIRKANEDSRVILTYDRDFGKMAILTNEPFTGIIFIRPGHIEPEYASQCMDFLLNEKIDFGHRFIIVIERIANEYQIRIRQLS